MSKTLDFKCIKVLVDSTGNTGTRVETFLLKHSVLQDSFLLLKVTDEFIFPVDLIDLNSNLFSVTWIRARYSGNWALISLNFILNQETTLPLVTWTRNQNHRD